MRTITLEEHFVSPAFLEGPGRALTERGATAGDRMAGVLERLRDLDQKRLGEMDEAQIDVQVLSLTSPGVEQLDAPSAIRIAHETNDFLASAVAKHPTRFAGFAAIPTAAPDEAAAELERLVRGHGFKGAAINGHQRGRYLDDVFFEPILARAEALGVPIYLHPTQPPQPVVDAWYGGFSKELSFMFANPGWGWHIETAVHVLRMVLGGVFDRHPRLQIVIGHMGEALPFMMSRVDVMGQGLTGLQRPVSAYLRENVHYTFSGFNFVATFMDLLMQVGVDRIMFSADYPYASMAQARAFLDRLPVSPSDRSRIAHGNAERLLGL
ncbi:MAG TPA: amidohydrolase family protein [Gemmatimonadaceae bacterium]|nr:amidohydrolase family protein [Gemmatimonadaceae bacterium]